MLLCIIIDKAEISASFHANPAAFKADSTPSFLRDGVLFQDEVLFALYVP